MNVQEYINSGSIESCVLGLADESEQLELERLCREYPEIRAAREAFESSLESAAFSGATPPPASLRNDVFAAIEREKPSPVIPLHTPQQPTPATSWKKYLSAAAIILLAGSAALNFYLYNQYSRQNRLYNDLLASQQELAATNRSIQTRLLDRESDLQMMRDPKMQQVKMTAVNNSNSLSTVYWNEASRDVYLLVNNLPAPAAGQQYQLWAIVDGKPVDAGLVSLDAEPGLLRMKNIPRAEAFAITLEKAGGSPSPTLTAMYVLGKV